ncbi:MAG: hypothetical protein HW406_2220 [Candidatus Brocadiaceae bacterium]|nr:hypothetical protein [Candidatus Brocadiaceae bacterium]
MPKMTIIPISTPKRHLQGFTKMNLPLPTMKVQIPVNK